MAIIRKTDLAKMSEKEREEKLKELRRELVKEHINLSKGGKTKIREIKKTIARLLTMNTINRLNKSVERK